jgi:hypothetical protein
MLFSVVKWQMKEIVVLLDKPNTVVRAVLTRELKHEEDSIDE